MGVIFRILQYIMCIMFSLILLLKPRRELRPEPVLSCSEVVIGDAPVSYWLIFSLFLVHCVRVQEVSVGVNSSQFPFCFVKWQIRVRCCRCTCNTCLSSMAVLPVTPKVGFKREPIFWLSLRALDVTLNIVQCVLKFYFNSYLRAKSP